MQEKTRIDILNTANLYGSEHYTLTVEIINLSDRPLSDVRVRALFIPGKNLISRKNPLSSETGRYEYESQAILKELNLQVMEAYSHLKLEQKTAETNKSDSDIILPNSSGHPESSSAQIRTPLFSSKFGMLPTYSNIDKEETLC